MRQRGITWARATTAWRKTQFCHFLQWPMQRRSMRFTVDKKEVRQPLVSYVKALPSGGGYEKRAPPFDARTP